MSKLSNSLKVIMKLIDENKQLLGERYKVKSIGVFGSYSRSESRPGSDVDILVEFYESPDLFEFMRLEEFLGKLLGKKVDLVSKNALKPLIRDEILQEAVYI